MALAYQYLYFKDCKVFKIHEDARVYASKLYDIEMEDGYGIIEYGVCDIVFDVPFPDFTDELIEEILHLNED